MDNNNNLNGYNITRNINNNTTQINIQNRHGLQFISKYNDLKQIQYICQKYKWSLLIKKWNGPYSIVELENLIRKLLNNQIKKIKFCTEYNVIFNIDNVIKIKDYFFL